MYKNRLSICVYGPVNKGSISRLMINKNVNLTIFLFFLQISSQLYSIFCDKREKERERVFTPP